MAKKSFGQHFLANKGAADGIVAAADVDERSHVLEIGPGHGVLTSRLLASGADVTAIEADRDLEFRLRDKFPHLRLIMADAVRFDFSSLEADRHILVSNLPYNVSKPLLMRFYHERERFPRWVLMMQKEVADRLTANRGTKAWGPLSILFQNRCEIRVIAKLGPNSFRPPPNVDSTVLRFDVRDEPLEELGDEDAFIDTLFALFRERRKTLSNRLKSLQVQPPEILSGLVLTGMERAESLDLKTISEVVRRIVAARNGQARTVD